MTRRPQRFPTNSQAATCCQLGPEGQHHTLSVDGMVKYLLPSYPRFFWATHFVFDFVGRHLFFTPLSLPNARGKGTWGFSRGSSSICIKHSWVRISIYLHTALFPFRYRFKNQSVLGLLAAREPS